jgi:hypothetical protein
MPLPAKSLTPSRRHYSAIETGTFAAFEGLAAQFGCTDTTMARWFVNPLAGYAYDLEGTDSHQIQAVPGSGQGFPIAPKFARGMTSSHASQAFSPRQSRFKTRLFLATAGRCAAPDFGAERL